MVRIGSFLGGKMSILFTPIRIRNMEVKNRFMRSATGDRLGEGTGFPSERQVRFYAEIAAGGIGLIVSGQTAAHPSGKSYFSQNSLDRDEHIPRFKSLTAAVHEKGAKIAVQLNHSGREAAKYRNPMNEEAIAPSSVENDPFFTGKYRPMTEAEIWEVIHGFGDAARRAREAGFDSVQLHGAHAYLLMQFLSPFTNRRRDEWGGSLENRLRFHKEIYFDVRRKAGDDYPLLVKLGVEDGFPGGLEFREGLQAAKALAELGFDSLEISGGLRGKRFEGTEFRTNITPEREGYYRAWCREVKRQISGPVAMVGGLRSIPLMEEVIRKGETDLVSLCRPLIREPGLIRRWAADPSYLPACISCNKCLESLFKGVPLHCAFQKNEWEG